MTETPLVRQGDAADRTTSRRPWLPVAIAALALALLAAGAGWWFLGRPQTIPDWEHLAEIDLASPAGDAFRSNTPWVSLHMSPARAGEDNAIRVQITPRSKNG